MPHILFEYSFLNGSFIDCLELYLWCRKHGIDIRLSFLANMHTTYSSALDCVRIMYNDRYPEYFTKNLIENDISNETISIISPAKVPSLGSIIVFDYNTLSKISEYKLNNLAVVSNVLPSEKSLLESLKCDNSKIFYEKPYRFVGNTEYRQKYLLDELKTHYMNSKEKKQTLIVCQGLNRNEFFEEHRKGIWSESRYDFTTFEFMYRGKGNSYISDMICRTKEILYFRSPVLYDRKPRILLEGMYLGIPIHYYDLKNCSIGDGSSLRWSFRSYDTNDRLYTMHDEVIKWILQQE